MGEKKLAPVNSGTRFMSFRVATGLISGSEWCFHVCQPWHLREWVEMLVIGPITPFVSGTVCVSPLRSAQLRADHDDINVDKGAVSKPSALSLQTVFWSVCDLQKCSLCRQPQRFWDTANEDYVESRSTITYWDDHTVPVWTVGILRVVPVVFTA